MSRRHGDYALVGVAATVRVVDGFLVSAKAGYLSVGDVPTVVDLVGVLANGLTDAALDDAVELVVTRLEPGDDIHATAAYRTQLVRVLTVLVLREAHQAVA